MRAWDKLAMFATNTGTAYQRLDNITSTTTVLNNNKANGMVSDTVLSFDIDTTVVSVDVVSPEVAFTYEPSSISFDVIDVQQFNVEIPVVSLEV